MAYENLRAAIMQNIKTNNQEEITGAVMQQILLQMVSELGAWDVTLNSYATSQWVQEQLNGYATQAALSNYLPLDGGTLTGSMNFTNTYGSGSIFVDSVDYDLNIVASNSIYLNAERGVGINGKITANTFEKSGGTSSQFLKADGSVDNNTYVTASALTSYATQSWVNTRLDSYLPLTGGTMNGGLNFADENGQAVRGVIFGDEYGLSIQVSGSGKLLIENAIEADNTIKTEGFIKRGGTADQVLCADGSVKTLAQLKAALNAL